MAGALVGATSGSVGWLMTARVLVRVGASVSGTVYTRGLSSLPVGLSGQLVQAVSDMVSSAHLVASQLPAGWAVAVADQADRAYVHAMDCVLAICAVTSGVVAVIAALAAVSRRVRRS